MAPARTTELKLQGRPLCSLGALAGSPMVLEWRDPSGARAQAGSGSLVERT